MKKSEAKPLGVEGDWDWCEIAANLPGGWIILENKPKGSHTWGFIGNDIMISNERAYVRYVVKYRYDPEKLRLTLYGHSLDDKGEPEILIKENYRVEFPASTEMFLYDLDDVEPGEEESLRLRFRRI